MNGGFIDVIDANSGKVYAQVVNGCAADTDAAVEVVSSRHGRRPPDILFFSQAAATAFKTWSRTTLEERKGYIGRILEEYESRIDEVAEALQYELGAPKLFARKVQATQFSAHLKTALEISDSFEWQRQIGNSTVVKEPIGVVGCITPW